MKNFSIKLYDGVRVITSEEIVKVKYIADLWELFHWDIVSDPKAKEAAGEVTRWLIACGRLDMTEANHGRTLIVELY